MNAPKSLVEINQGQDLYHDLFLMLFSFWQSIWRNKRKPLTTCLLTKLEYHPHGRSEPWNLEIQAYHFGKFLGIQGKALIIFGCYEFVLLPVSQWGSGSSIQLFFDWLYYMYQLLGLKRCASKGVTTPPPKHTKKGILYGLSHPDGSNLEWVDTFKTETADWDQPINQIYDVQTFGTSLI